MAETLKFRTNVPETIALAYTKGKEVEGAYGDQVMFTLQDGRRVYLDPWVAEKIDCLQLGRGELFTIVRREIQKSAGRKSIDFDVWRGADTAQAAAPQSVPSTPRNGSSAIPHEKEQPQGTTAAPERLTHELVASIGASRIELALCAAIDAAAKAEAHAKEKGLSIRFGPEDVRAIGLSLFIAMDRGGNSWKN